MVRVTFKDYPLVEIEWDDHSGDAGWIDDPKKSKSVVARTIGYLVDEDDIRIVVHDSLTEDGGSGGESVILQSCVRKRWVIEVQDN